MVAKLRRLPLVTRNLDLGDFEVPKRPPALATDPLGADAVAPVVAALGLTISMHDGGSSGYAAAGLAIAVVLALVSAVVLAVHVGTLMRANLRGRLTEAATIAIEDLAPEVVVYFAATVEEIYQVQMWLDPVERLGRRSVVVLRGYDVFDALDDVSLPVICTAFNGTIASIPLPSRVVAMFPTHSGNNLPMLRRPEVRSVLHRARRQRQAGQRQPVRPGVRRGVGRRTARPPPAYEQAGVGVKDSAIVEVGRPQIRVTATEPQVPTIVYAPTWEGWGTTRTTARSPTSGRRWSRGSRPGRTCGCATARTR